MSVLKSHITVKCRENLSCSITLTASSNELLLSCFVVNEPSTIVMVKDLRSVVTL